MVLKPPLNPLDHNLSGKLAERTRYMIYKTRDCNLFLDNYQQFAAACLNGDFENSCNFFTFLENEIPEKSRKQSGLYGIYN